MTTCEEKAQALWKDEKDTIELAIQVELNGWEADGNTPAGTRITLTDAEALILLINMARSSDFWDYLYGIDYKKYIKKEVTNESRGSY